MTLRNLATSLLMASTAAARTLYVGSSQGTITAYNFDESHNSLRQLFQTSEITPASTWQTIYGNILYSVSQRNASTVGVVTAYKIEEDKTLTKKEFALGLPGPVSIAVANEGKLLVVAAYGGRGVDTFTTDNQGHITHNQNFTYTLDKPGPVANRQEAPHPHQALVDPTGKFAIVPDLGADLLRVYCIGDSGIDELFTSWVKTPEGAGPRHAVFYPPGAVPPTHLFVVGELSNKILTYKVTYGDDGQIGLDNIASVSTFGSDAAAASISSAKAGEIDISPDGKYLYVSNRLVKSQSPNTQDSLAAFSISPSSARLSFLQLSASGGTSPRHFEISRDGNLVAIANDEGDGNFGIFRRYNGNGAVSSLPLISMGVQGASCAHWYEGGSWD